MKRVLKKYMETNLVIRIIIGLVIGAVMGLLVPSWSVIGILGNLFVNALKAVAPVLVFVLVISSLANAGAGIGKKFRTVIILYMLSTLLAAFVAVIGSELFPVTLSLTQAAAENTAPEGIGEVLQTLLLNMVSNPVKAIGEANYIGVLTWAVVFGLALKQAAGENTKNVLQNISDAVTKAVHWVIDLAPFGIMGLVFLSVSENGMGIFTDYGKLLLLLVGCMLAVALIVNPFIA